MTEKESNLKNMSAESSEVSTNQQQQTVEKKLTTLKGFTTSQIRKREKLSDTPAYCFLKEDCWEKLSDTLAAIHSYPTTDIPIIFRIKENSQWIKPKIKKGSYLEVKGHFDKPINGNKRKSFTAYSYQLLDPNLANKLVLDEAKNQLPQFEAAYQQIKATREYLESHE